MGDDVATGVAIDAVSAGTSADAGGMLAGDVIVGWDNKKVADMQDLFERLQTHEPGDKVKITVIRGGEKIVLDITLKAS
jgi:putative serine protease PepD